MATSLSDDTPAVLVATVNQVPQFLAEATSCWLPTNRSVGKLAGRCEFQAACKQAGRQEKSAKGCTEMHEGDLARLKESGKSAREALQTSEQVAWQHEGGVMRIGECA